MKLIAGALITAVLLSGCSQSRIDGEIQKNTTSATPSPQAEVTSPQDLFISKLNIDIKKELESYSDYTVVIEPLALSRFIKYVDVESDPEFGIVTITAQAEHWGDITDGSATGLVFDDPIGTPKIFCSGKNNFGNDTFLLYVKMIFRDILAAGGYETVPSKGLIFRINWSSVDEITDKFGGTTQKITLIGTDQIGISNNNLMKIVDPNTADYRKLSDLAPVQYAKKSWHNGVCASAQRRNN